MNNERDDVMRVVRSELAQYEHRMRTDGASLVCAVEKHTDELLRYGVTLPGASEEYRAQSMAEACAYAERGKIRAAALTRISIIVARILRAIGGEMIYDRDALPPTVRQTRYDERGPMTIAPIEVVTQAARDNGILQEDESGTNQTKES
jgi:hypothetical protein